LYQPAPSYGAADACVVRLVEIHEDHCVLTLDSDFTVYRRHGRLPIPVLHPAGSR
jgi:hypothetical protein